MHENTGPQFHPHILGMMIVEPLYVVQQHFGSHHETPQIFVETPTLEDRDRFFRANGKFAVY